MLFFRRKYLINRRVQMRYSLLFVIIALVGNICSVILFNVLALRKLDSVMWSTHIAVKSTAEILHPLFISVNASMFFFIAVLLILSGKWMIRNASGPLFRMSKDMGKIAEGDLSVNISLRHKDEFQSVADTLNDMTAKLRTEFSSIKKSYDRISRIMDRVDESAGESTLTREDCDRILNTITDLEEQLKKCKAE